MKRPLIGICTDLVGQDPVHVSLALRYPVAIERAGGIPFPLPPVSDPGLLHEIVSMIDGLLLSGGGDINPRRYGADLHPKSDLISPIREAFDFSVLERALDHGRPVLAICLGAQELCVHFGGTLIQDIPDQMENTILHRPPRGHQIRHEVRIVEGTLLYRIVGKPTLDVNSTHHQSVASVSPPLRVAARAPDGVIEAAEHPDYPFVLALQWHPEALPAEDIHQKIIRAFVDACRR